MKAPIAGFVYILEGFQLIFKPGLRRFVVIPVMINILFFVLLFLLMRYYMGEFNAWFLQHLPAWLHWLSGVLWVFFFLSFLLIFIYTFVTIANLIAAPFNSFLAEKVELYLTGTIPPQRGWLENMADIPRTIGRQLALLGYYLPRALVLVVLFFIPVVHIIVAVIWFLFNAWFMAITYVDYPTDNHRIPLSKVRTWLWERYGLSLSFGMGVVIVAMIPILNFFVIPAAVAGATKLWVEENT